MGKKASRRATSSAGAGRASAGASTGSTGASEPATSSGSATAVPVVGGREPCPCGSGRRYKACHGRAGAAATEAFVGRPFEGLAGECDWVALREIVPAATAPLSLTGEYADRAATLATVLPLASAGLVREDGTVFLALQVAAAGGSDPSRDLAAALVRALAAEPGSPVAAGAADPDGPRLQDLLDPAAPLEVTTHQGFDFWLPEDEERTPDVVASMERANSAVVPTARLVGVDAAYWCQIRDRNHVRWVMPHDEEALLDAMARLHAADADRLGEDSRYVGSFRAHGLLVPVWDLPQGTPAEAVEEPAAAFAGRLGEALADDSPLDAAALRARAGLRSRQLTLR